MNIESVIEFLRNVPLLRRSSSSSLRRIAEVVEVKHFDGGEIILRLGVDGGGIYFIWEGEADVCGNTQETIHPEFHLKRYDYFGNGVTPSSWQADVIASSKLTCLMLPNEHSALLAPKSIWSEDDKHKTSAHMDRILHLQPLKANLFQGCTLPDAPQIGNVFGGQFMGQALIAASKTVDRQKTFYQFQAYFLLAGDVDVPITYSVRRLHETRNFDTRRVDAIQKGIILFTLLASFQKEEMGFEHQIPVIPSLPPPDKLLSLEEIKERRITDPRLAWAYRHEKQTTYIIPLPIDIRFCDSNTSTNQTTSPTSLRFWFKAKEKLSDDQSLHRCVIAYASDLIFIQVSSYIHVREGVKIGILSLNHAMWFHRVVKADDWILFLIESPTASGGRSFCTGKMFNQRGELIVSVTQEGLLRKLKLPPENTAIRAKY